MIGEGKTRLPIDIDKIRNISNNLANDIINDPMKAIKIL